eukprot:2568027-Pleurochrysis_carterae.AAC.1
MQFPALGRTHARLRQTYDAWGGAPTTDARGSGAALAGGEQSCLFQHLLTIGPTGSRDPHA